MKLLAVLALLMSFYFNSHAQNFPLLNENKGDKGNPQRTPVITPTASIEDDLLSVDMQVFSDEIMVSIQDHDGQIVYQSVFCLTRTFCIDVSELPTGEYKITVNNGEEYEGEFEIE